MAIATQSGEKPDRCPCCGREYAFRVPLRKDDHMKLVRHYRCGRHAGYVYVHQIDHRSGRFHATKSLELDGGDGD